MKAWPGIVLLAALAAGLVLAPAAQAQTRTLTLTSRAWRLDGFQTRLPKGSTPAPGIDGYLVGMDAYLVDRRGRRVPIRKVMLHHLVFMSFGRGEARSRTSCEGRRGQPFYGTGEERQRLALPPGYGYRIRRGDRWWLQSMLMGHSLRSATVRVAYRMRIVTGRRLTPVRPLWLRANGCTTFPSYDIPGGQGPVVGQAATWRMPLSGRIVAAGAHLHGSAKALTVRQPRCGDRELFRHEARYAPPGDPVYRVRPVLHEPGPVATGYLLSRAGIAVHRGETLKVTGLYDGTRPHPLAMAITHVYIAPGHVPKARCPRLPRDRRTAWTRTDGSLVAPVVRVPLSGVDALGRVVEIARPPGEETVLDSASATIDVARGAFRPANLSVPAGARVVWRFRDRVRHNAVLADGPRVISAPIRRRGATYVRRLTEPGTYKVFCTLHPVTMQQVVTVRPA